MAVRAHELVVFVASPGDCGDERELVRRVASDVTQSVGIRLGLRLRVEGWEGVPPEFGRPQELINPLVDECDVFLGLLGYRWGSPTGTHSSGFHEEYERAVKRRKFGDFPKVAMFFRSAPEVMDTDPGPELEKVLAFERSVREEHALLYSTFGSVNDLESKLWQYFGGLLAEYRTSESEGDARATESIPDADDHNSEDLTEDDLDDARRQIASTVDAVAKLALGTGQSSFVDHDRFLLVALGLNDDGGNLPTHVANRLFVRRKELTISRMEHHVWLRSIVTDVGSSASRADNVLPGWAITGFDDSELIGLLEIGNATLAAGVFRILQRAALRPAGLWEPDQDTNLQVKRWVLALETPGSARVAQQYLADTVTTHDLWLLDAIIAQANLKEVSLLRAVLAGNLMPMASAAVKSRYGSEWQWNIIRKRLGVAADEVIHAVVVGPNTPTEHRVLAAQELHDRGLVDDETLRSLLTIEDLEDLVFEWGYDDSSPITGMQLLKAVSEIDNKMSRRGRLNHRALALVVPSNELVARIERGDNALSAWDTLEWKRDGDLVDLARSIYDADADSLVLPLEGDPSWTADEKILPFLRASIRLGALRNLANQCPLPAEDRMRLLCELDRSSTYTKNECLRWFAQCATLDDVDRLIEELSNCYLQTADIVIDAILRVGGRDAAWRLIEMNEKGSADKAVEAIANDQSVTVDELRRLLYSSVDTVRITALDAIAARSSGTELEALLQEYPRTQERYYYNVVCELDWHLFFDHVS